MDLHLKSNMDFFALPILFLCSFLSLTSAANVMYDLEAAPSIASDYKVQTVESGNKYGYPYRIAPTLTPVIQARSDDDESATSSEKLPVAKPYGSRIANAAAEDGIPVKKGHLKKGKIIYASRRQDSDDTSVEKRFRNYVQPKYRNNDELEKDFQPRRMDIDIPYSQYSYPRPSRSRKFQLSPIDPYLTPSAGHGDSFYPVPKVKTYPSSSYGHAYDGPSYGAGKYEEPIHYHDSSYGGPSSYTSSGGPSSSYPPSGGPSNYPSSGGPSSYTSSGGPSSSYPSSGGPSSYTSSGGPSSSYPSSGGPSSYPSSGGPSSYTSSGGPSSSYPSSGGPSPSYPSSGGPSSSYTSSGGSSGYTDGDNYHENYSVKTNEPIIGSIRKRLLNYAGATDLYEGEPDYLRQVTRNKHKYGNLGNDYYSYGGPLHRDSYREFPYVESKISLIKKARGL